MNLVEYGGAALVVFSAVLMMIFDRRMKRSRKRSTLRFIPAFQRLRRAAGLSVEEGRRLHISLGNSSLLAGANASALVGLSALERMARLSAVSDRPAVASSGNAALAILSQDVLHAGLGENYRLRYGQLSGVTPYAYIAGTLPLISDEQVGVNLFAGHFGPEYILLNDAAEQQNAFVLASSDSLSAQSVMYAASQEPVLGEELFATPAYLQANAMHVASLRVQDILRWLVILAMLAGTAYSVLKFFGYL